MKHTPSGALTRASLLASASLCAISTGHAANTNGSWTGVTSPGLWSNVNNWTGGLVADGAGNTADFSITDLPDGIFSVSLDTPRTIGNLTFGDTNTTTAGSWLIDNNFDTLNILTLAGTPVVTVNGLGAGAQAEISAEVAGTANISKAGAGILALSGVNTYSGGTTVNAGTLAINSATGIGTGALTINGGALDNTSFGAVTLSTNNAQTWNSNVVFTGTQSLNLGTGAVAAGAVVREVTTNANTLTVGGVVTSSGGITKSGAGQLTLTANNLASLTGPRLFKGGTLALGGSQANTQQALGSTTGTLTFEGGTLSLNGSGNTDNATGWGTLANPITVASGQTGTLNTMPRGTVTSTLTGAGTFNFKVRATRGDVNANWAGFTGNLNISTITAAVGDFRIASGAAAGTVFNASMRVNIDNAWVYQSANPPNSGALTSTHQIGKLSGTSTSNMGGSAVNGRFVTWQVGALNEDSEYAGTIANSAGQARFTKVGTGTLTLSGACTYTGDTTLSAGTLQIGNGGGTGSLAATNVITTVGAQLIFNRDDSAVSAYPGILSGAGTITKRGLGQVNFTGANTYTAGTAIEGGNIGINSASSLGATTGAVSFTTANGGVIASVPGIVDSHPFSVASGITASLGGATAADSLELTNSVTGAGSLAVGGSGVLTLSGANTYGGTTTVANGTLVATNASGSATSTGAVALNVGTLAGTGTISGAVTAATGSSIKPGSLTPTSSGVGSLTVGSLSLAGGTTIYTEFTDATTYDKIIVSNTNGLTSSASLANPVMVDLRVVNSSAKWTAPGAYTIAQFAGTFSGNANDLFEVTSASQQSGQTYTFSVSGNSLLLTIGGALPSIWNVNASGNWTTAGNWLNGSPNAIGATAELGSVITGPQTVTLDASRTVGLLKFNNANAYTIDGSSTLTLNQTTGNAEIQVLSGGHTISTPIALTDSVDINLFNAANSLSLLGNLSGSGAIAKSGPGNLTLGGNSNFSGGVNFANGTLTFSNNSLGTGTLTLSNATLVWASGNSQDITDSRTVVFGESPITFAMDDNVTLANDLGTLGGANLTKDGVGTLTFLADTTFNGNVTVANGNLTLGNGGATGSVVGSIDLANASSVLTVSRSGDHTINNFISGAGGLVLNGAGIHTINQANTFTGSTTINSGIAYLASGTALQGSTVAYNTSGGSLNFGTNLAVVLGGLEGDKNLTLENTDTTPAAVSLTVGGNGGTATYTGILSGTGSLTKTGAGTLSMTGAHTYSGFTQVNGGVLDLASTVTLNNTTVSVGANATLTSMGTINASALSNVANSPAGPAALDILGGIANFPLGINATGNNTQGYHIQVATGATLTAGPITLGRSGLNLGTEPTTGSATDGLRVTGGDVDINGELTLGNASSNSSVSTQITGGTLDVTGPISVGLNNGGRWSVIDVENGAFTSTDITTGVRLGGPQQGNAAFLTRGGVATVERFQFGNLALGGTSTVHVSGGELYVGSGGMVIGTTEPGFVATLRLSGGTLGAKADWSTSIPVATSNSVTVKAADASNTAHNITLSGAISGTGSLVKQGGGTVTVSGAYSYSGDTTVSAGSLALSSGTLSDTGIVDVAAGATLNLNFVGSDTIAGFSIGGVPQASGTWGAIGSGAAHQTARITGTGLLVIPTTDPFAGWISGFPGVGAQTAKTDDPDSDGLTNLDEFALDGNPASGAVTGKVRSQIETVGADKALVITLPVRDGASFTGATSLSATIDGVVYTIEGSNNLSLFDQGVTEIAASSSGMPTPLSTGWSYRTFRLNGAIGGATPRGPKGFLHVKVAAAP